MAGRSLLVIGGTGFFGKSILDAYARNLLAPWQIERIVVVARSIGALTREHPDLVGPGVELLSADVGTVDAFPATDYVIHAASSTDATRYQADPAQERSNILNAIDNYQRIALTCHRDARIVYTSSGAIYGQQPEDIPLLDEAYRPTDAGGLVAYKRDYAEAKLVAEQRVAALGSAGLRVSIARCFTFIGAHLPREKHFAIGNFLADGLVGRSITVKARKPVFRSYMHTDDLVRWLMTIADNATSACPVYNVGSEEGLLMGDVAMLVGQRLGVEAKVPPLTEPGADRYVPSVLRARTELGLTLHYDLRTAIDDVVDRIRSGERLTSVG